MKYTHNKIENLYPFGIEFNSKPSLFMRFILWMVGFKKYKMTKKEIIKESIKRHPRFEDRRVGFIDGVEWMQEQLSKENEGQALLYAVEKTAERTKREMIEKAVKWLDKNVDNYCFNTGNRYEYIPKVGRKMLEDFRQAMQDESK